MQYYYKPTSVILQAVGWGKLIFQTTFVGGGRLTDPRTNLPEHPITPPQQDPGILYPPQTDRELINTRCGRLTSTSP